MVTLDIPVLDHGRVRLLNIAGPTRRADADFDADDVDPANTARTSFDQMNSGRTRDDELRLLDYLMRSRHTSPFEMIEVWFDVKAPIFVARQLYTHRTSSRNEVSARYVKLPEEWYIPEVVGSKPTGGAKQGRSEDLPPVTQDWFKSRLDWNCRCSYEDYLTAIERGVAPEHARMLLHVNHYTRFVWKQDLHNLMHLLSLRDHPHAQWEIRQYAQAMDRLVRSVLPDLMGLYDTYRRQP